jgi:hypothetical protein
MSHAQHAALRAAFGSESDDEAAGEAHPVVHGLHVLRGFLSPPAQDALLAAVRAQGWAAVTDGAARNQAMVFGHAALPPFAQRLCADVAAAAAAHAMLPPDLLHRGPFNQLICNTYAPGTPPFRAEYALCFALTRPGAQARASAHTLTWLHSPTASPACHWALPWSWTSSATEAPPLSCCAPGTC